MKHTVISKVGFTYTKKESIKWNINDGMVKYNLETNHKFIFKDSKILVQTGSLAYGVECSPKVRETWVQSQVESY